MKYYEALGNRYLLADGDSRWPEDRVVSVCRRYGSDGLLVERPSDRPDFFRLQIYNPDGSEAENSGNGTRIFALSVWESGRLRPADPCPIMTTGGCLAIGRLTLPRNRWPFHQDDRPASAGIIGKSYPIAVRFEGYRIEDRPLDLMIGGRHLRGHRVFVGNPNFVLEVEEIDENFFRRFGPLIECHPAFPERTNVQFLKIMRDNSLFLRIWERGAGSTLSSGTGACAAAIFARWIRRCSPRPIVTMAGGRVRVDLTAESLQLAGPVRRLF